MARDRVSLVPTHSNVLDKPSKKKRKRKAGSRVTGQGIFKGDGQALNADIYDEDKRKATSTFKKKAGR